MQFLLKKTFSTSTLFFIVWACFSITYSGFSQTYTCLQLVDKSFTYTYPHFLVDKNKTSGSNYHVIKYNLQFTLPEQILEDGEQGDFFQNLQSVQVKRRLAKNDDLEEKTVFQYQTCKLKKTKFKNMHGAYKCSQHEPKIKTEKLSLMLNYNEHNKPFFYVYDHRFSKQHMFKFACSEEN